MQIGLNNVRVVFAGIALKSTGVVMGLALTMLIEKNIGTEQLGIYNQLQLFLSYLTLFALFGNDQYMFQNRNELKSFKSILGSKLPFIFLAALLGFILIERSYGFVAGSLFALAIFSFASNRLISFYRIISHGWNYSTIRFELFPSLILLLGIIFYSLGWPKLDFSIYIILILFFSRLIGLRWFALPTINQIVEQLKSSRFTVISIMNLVSNNWELLLVSFIWSKFDFAILSINYKLSFAFSAIAVSIPLRRLNQGMKTIYLKDLMFEPMLMHSAFLVLLFLAYPAIINFWGDIYVIERKDLIYLMLISFIYVLNATLSLGLLENRLENYDIVIRLFRMISSLILILFISSNYSFLNWVTFISVTEFILKLLIYVRHNNGKLSLRGPYE